MSSILNLLMGKVGENSHPMHPATVHFPLTFLMTASFLDIVTYVGLKSPLVIYPLIRLFSPAANYPTHSDEIAFLGYVSLASYFSTVASVITSAPALVTGVAEGYALISANGLDLSNPKVRTTITHASLNDLAIGLAAYNWYTRRGVDGYAINGVNAAISAVMFLGTAYSGYLGGGLVYARGVGVQRQGSGAELKKEQMENAKKEGAKKGGKKEL